LKPITLSVRILRTYFWIALIGVFSGIPRCVASPDTRCFHQAYFGEIPLSPRSIRFYTNGSVKSGRIDRNTLIGGHMLSRRTLLNFHEDGVLESAVSPIHQKYGSFNVHKGTTIEFHRNGKMKTIFTGKGGGWYRDRYYPGGTNLSFSADGAVASDSFYAQAERIRDPLNGSRRIAILETPWSTPHISLPIGTLISSSAVDNYIRVVMQKNWHWAGLEFERGAAKLRHDGRVQSATLAHVQKINDIAFLVQLRLT